MAPRIVWLVALLAASQACRKAARVPGPTQRHALPGFSIMIPEGKVLEDDAKAYATGNYSIGEKGSWVVMVSWDNGPLSSSERRSYQESWKLELDHPLPIKVPKLESETFVGTNHAPARVTFVTCGQRHVVIASIDHDNVDKLHADVLAGFTCSPDPAQEHRAGAHIELADRTGWQRVGDHPDMVILERGGGAQMMMAFYYATEPDKATVEKLVSKYEAKVGDGDPRPLSSPLIRGWARTVRCAADNWVVAMYVESGSGAADRTVIDGLRCLRPDEAEVTWPAAPAELQQLAK
jgi:hypothetical protein